MCSNNVYIHTYITSIYYIGYKCIHIHCCTVQYKPKGRNHAHFMRGVGVVVLIFFNSYIGAGKRGTSSKVEPVVYMSILLYSFGGPYCTRDWALGRTFKSRLAGPRSLNSFWHLKYDEKKFYESKLSTRSPDDENCDVGDEAGVDTASLDDGSEPSDDEH